MRESRPRLVAFDEEAIVAEYQAGDAVQAICGRHDVGLNRLYAILDRHQVPRLNPNAPRIDRRRRRLILKDYEGGLSVETIAKRHQVSHGTVSSVAAKAGVSRGHVRCHDELVGLIVRWFMGEHLPADERHAIERVGVGLTQPGMRSLAEVDHRLVRDVRQVLAERLLKAGDRPLQDPHGLRTWLGVARNSW